MTRPTSAPESVPLEAAALYGLLSPRRQSRFCKVASRIASCSRKQNVELKQVSCGSRHSQYPRRSPMLLLG
jgi:hypothetical protein